MVTQVSLLDCELCHSPDNLGNKDGDSNMPSSSQETAANEMPEKTDKTVGCLDPSGRRKLFCGSTASWQGNSSAISLQIFIWEIKWFASGDYNLTMKCFSRQNFEKITCCVQSKNKDQVRHYYYRLVRRMNKLLGPELSLDAKNSKDTNTAMLRWWSLLEKYSCKASRLRLKPRRYKIFVETLENQLLKDRKKNIKKHLSSGENNPPIPIISASNQVRPPGHDDHTVKMLLVDSQNIQKVKTGKGALFKRHMNMETSRTNCKVDPPVKTAKHRRKTGLATTAAYKRWEKAAIAGVSLVADAAEHLEKVNTKEIENFQRNPGGDGSQIVGEVQSIQMSPQIKFNENINPNSTKLKLQLFPIDECIRKALEKDHHNPHLELTLSTRKKISSILEHLYRKWESSNLLNQELMLFPYWAQRENLVGYQKWTKDSTLCAADVHYLIGNPSVFRLRYGWFSKAEVESVTAQVLSYTNIKEQNLNTNTATEQNTEIENLSGPYSNQLVSAEQIIHLSSSSTSTPIKTSDFGVSVSNINDSKYNDSPTVVSSYRTASGDFAVIRQVENTKDNPLSAGEWADSLTNISMGDLLSKSTHNLNINCTEFPTPLASNCLQQAPFSCDSFDAAIAAHIYKHQNRVDSQEGHHASRVPSSIWDCEETCDSFAFKKTSAFCDKDPTTYMNSSPEGCEQAINTSPSESDKEVKEWPEVEKLANSGDLVDNCRAERSLENSTKDFSGISDIYWPDSLGPLDLDISSCRYHNSDLILSDSLGGLNRLIANSMDAFQSCSFFGLDRKEPPSKSEAQQNASFLDFTAGNEV
ncbi:TSL-kinase interacting protein 1 [Orobanche gracilis]